MGPAANGEFCGSARSVDRQPGGATSPRGIEGHLSQRLASSPPTQISPVEMYPDQSLYPANSVPAVIRRINNALLRADQIDHADGKVDIDWMVPIVADAEAGFGGPLNVFELMKAMIEAGAAGVHLEDQLASEKKCGHMGGKVLVPTAQAIRNPVAARLAADVSNVPTIIIARTDANGAKLLTSDIDERDREFLTGGRTPGGIFLRP